MSRDYKGSANNKRLMPNDIPKIFFFYSGQCKSRFLSFCSYWTLLLTVITAWHQDWQHLSAGPPLWSRNISTSLDGWIASKCFKDIDGPQRMKPNYFVDLLTVPLVAPWGWHCSFLVKCLYKYWMAMKSGTHINVPLKMNGYSLVIPWCVV